MYIIIRKLGHKIIFEEYKKELSQKELNVTNVWNFKEIIFDEKKLKEPFIQVFLKELFLKEKITCIQIEKGKMLSFVGTLMDESSTIKEVVLKEDMLLSNAYYQHLSKLRAIDIFECFKMESSLFYQCYENLQFTIRERKKEFVKSNFLIANDLNTHSKLFYKKNVTFFDTYSYDDFRDFAYFLKENKCLEKIEFYGTNVATFFEMLNQIFKIKKIGICIEILQRNEESEELEEIVRQVYKKYKKKLKIQHIHLKIKYTNAYKEKNVLKQLNLNIFRLSVLILFFLTVSIYGISRFHAYNSAREAKKLEKLKEQLNTEITSNEGQQKENNIESNKTDQTEETNSQEETPTQKETPKKEEAYVKEMASLQKMNNEFTGWLTVNNTTISYPVVKHSDNDYYLTHGFNKKYNINGWIFMDYRNHTESFDQNTIIYGHDSNYSIMFGDLKKVLQKSWYTNPKNQIITYETATNKFEAEIFSIYVIDNTTDYLQVVFSDQEFETFIKTLEERSIYNFNREVTIQNKIITLSTCYKDSSKRLVVHAKIK